MPTPGLFSAASIATAPSSRRSTTPSELNVKLARLVDCIGQPSADAYDDADSGVHLELIREHRGHAAPNAPLAS